MKKTILIVTPIIFIDQFLKIYVKTHFKLGEGFSIFYFFRICFIENPGMAYGIRIFSGYNGKIILSIFRFFLIIIIFFFYYNNIKKNASNYLIIPVNFILSGAIGNFIDSALYGLLFNTGTVYNNELQKWIPYYGISKFNFFLKNGYSFFMEGCVVDMFYFPLINILIPKYIPILGGYNFQFFKPVFNLSDFFIFIGIILLLLFNNRIKEYISYF